MTGLKSCPFEVDSDYDKREALDANTYNCRLCYTSDARHPGNLCRKYLKDLAANSAVGARASARDGLTEEAGIAQQQMQTAARAPLTTKVTTTGANSQTTDLIERRRKRRTAHRLHRMHRWGFYNPLRFGNREMRGSENTCAKLTKSR
ncbi:hypothetical protein F5887DRAFT_918813 [Amanita rubescens]|nr:hypothetical protein F5887DRAFT_918813 [Amanita rubescens]